MGEDDVVGDGDGDDDEVVDDKDVAVGDEDDGNNRIGDEIVDDDNDVGVGDDDDNDSMIMTMMMSLFGAEGKRSLFSVTE